ncbi:N-hydroxyarylamine O-acetyltransferase [Umezawaea tangerina]|uniref:N-hydroxyarylamine O-acetyltransferase n=2 Tax=Umezawaea tangerina TaxID=84725 RepID=A0A2T0SC59_9PSEU|nr:N-hydroxyarylamine O-acetyltransferase [Umezawaea tangerina]
MIDAYLDRIGATRTTSPADLQELHLRAVPFENLSIHLGEPIVLDEDALVAKIATGRRGGFCYELNGAFAVLLRALGHPVHHLAARVYLGDRLSAPFEHLALRVDDTLLDVGFGDFALRPLSLTSRADQPDAEGVFRVVEAESGDLDVYQDDEPQYRLELRPRTLSDFAPMCWYQQHFPGSPFAKAPLATLPTGEGRVTVSGHRVITTVGGVKEEREVGDAELLGVYREVFGIELDRVPGRSDSAAPASRRAD